MTRGRRSLTGGRSAGNLQWFFGTAWRYVSTGRIPADGFKTAVLSRESTAGRAPYVKRVEPGRKAYERRRTSSNQSQRTLPQNLNCKSSTSLQGFRRSQPHDLRVPDPGFVVLRVFTQNLPKDPAKFPPPRCSITRCPASPIRLPFTTGTGSECIDGGNEAAI